MTTATRKLNLVEVRAKFMGYREVNCAPVFFVAIQEFKPQSGAIGSVPVPYRGERKFVIGRTYTIVVQDWNTKDREVVGATESV